MVIKVKGNDYGVTTFVSVDGFNGGVVEDFLPGGGGFHEYPCE